MRPVTPPMMYQPMAGPVPQPQMMFAPPPSPPPMMAPMMPQQFMQQPPPMAFAPQPQMAFGPPPPPPMMYGPAGPMYASTSQTMMPVDSGRRYITLIQKPESGHATSVDQTVWAANGKIAKCRTPFLDVCSDPKGD
ncbi:uncharacterized protein LOC125945032 [Dermacentor silvarum]|uniref:uncharacterized protein LOC125945032 n=1 Tax=Dermacentor silvarum TaxID=543639 RepID=UPI002101A860|nr:uncharacterized protein LOC125945032 [Dermacentor silvarum]